MNSKETNEAVICDRTDNSRNRRKQIAASFAFVAVLLLATFVVRQSTKAIIEDWQIGDSPLVWSISEAQIVDGRLEIEGIAYCFGDEQWIPCRRKSIWLKNRPGGETIRFVADDTTHYLTDDKVDKYAYRYCGFEVSIDLYRALDNDGVYEVYLAYQNNGKTYIEPTGLMIDSDMHLRESK